MTEFAFIATKKKASEQLQRAVFGRGKALGVLCSVLLVHPPLQEIGRSKYAGCEKSHPKSGHLL
jgi:hypothetical protein